jgi:putative endonuclease
MSNRHRTVYYLGVTADLPTRIYQHRNGEGSAFTKQYQCTDLIYYEAFGRIEEAIVREKQLKKWNRAWKERLVKEQNPILRDLSNDDEVMDF